MHDQRGCFPTSAVLTRSRKSPKQIAIFLLPLCVLIAACMGRELDMDLGPFELGSLATTVLLLVIVVQVRSNPPTERPENRASHLSGPQHPNARAKC